MTLAGAVAGTLQSSTGPGTVEFLREKKGVESGPCFTRCSVVFGGEGREGKEEYGVVHANAVRTKGEYIRKIKLDETSNSTCAILTWYASLGMTAAVDWTVSNRDAA